MKLKPDFFFLIGLIVIILTIGGFIHRANQNNEARENYLIKALQECEEVTPREFFTDESGVRQQEYDDFCATERYAVASF